MFPVASGFQDAEERSRPSGDGGSLSIDHRQEHQNAGHELGILDTASCTRGARATSALCRRDRSVTPSVCSAQNRHVPALRSLARWRFVPQRRIDLQQTPVLRAGHDDAEAIRHAGWTLFFLAGEAAMAAAALDRALALTQTPSRLDRRREYPRSAQLV
jgi:hypothetical protein